METGDGGTVSQGLTAMRVGVSSWATTDHDIDRCRQAIIRIATEVGPHGWPLPAARRPTRDVLSAPRHGARVL